LSQLLRMKKKEKSHCAPIRYEKFKKKKRNANLKFCQKNNKT